ncbi:hypothetical protein [Siccirubricoccus phaeus]|uniref:hypothetical protein n=1 Tax=Siccirubricoccus phaeus TaxID=2595053 RepID=UPI0011F12B3F|nr:hypothetical protein [Siccirubricoccus phaeus]
MLLTRRLLARWLAPWAALLPLAACDEGWQAEPPVRLPPGLPPGATEPRRWALEEVAARLLDRPAALRQAPEELPRVAALVEYLATAFQDGFLPEGRHLTRLLREGRTAMRLCLGIAADAPPQATADALFAGARPVAGVDPEDARLAPLRRALRATREALAAQLQPR